MEGLKSFYYDKKAQVRLLVHLLILETPLGSGVYVFRHWLMVGMMAGRPLLLNSHRPLWLRSGYDEPN